MNRRREVVEFGKDDLETLLGWSTSSLASLLCELRANAKLNTVKQRETLH
jgi:hypothetical protein